MNAYQFNDHISKHIEPTAISIVEKSDERSAVDIELNGAIVRAGVLLQNLPEGCRVVTDVGRSMCSGWGDIIGATYYPPNPKDHTAKPILELHFD